MAAVDANRIIPRLWQGSDPPRGPLLRQLGVDVLVLCAYERQHPATAFPGVRVIHVPMDDGRHVPDGVDRVARLVAQLHRRGARIMVCCAQGINRSGLVTASALRYIKGMSGRQALLHVQGARKGALRNDTFAAYLASLPALVPPTGVQRPPRVAP